MSISKDNIFGMKIYNSDLESTASCPYVLFPHTPSLVSSATEFSLDIYYDLNYLILNYFL